MGNSVSGVGDRKWTKRRKGGLPVTPPPFAESSRVLFLLYLIHRTWNVVIDHVDAKSARWRGSSSAQSFGRCGERGEHLDSISLGGESDAGSQYSFCSCSYCRMRDGRYDDCFSDLSYLDKMASRDSWSEEHVAKEKQRPPIYNPEDYTLSLKKWSKKSQPGDPGLYSALMEPNPTPQDSDKARTLPNQGSKDYRNPCLSPGEEMSLRQFGSASELLNKLRADLRLAFPSFVQEFVCEPLDGVSLLLELLRAVQLSQAGPPTLTGDGGSARGPPPRPSPAVQRRALLDELACLQCIWSCCSRYNEASRRLAARAGGLYALASCIMSSVNKSRVLALQLLTKSCNPPANGHTAVSEALSTLRLRFGEPVRFRFLVGMLSSAGGAELPAAGLAFINALLASAPTPQRKLYIQAELEQAGFDIITFRKMNGKTINGELIMSEIEHYEQQLIDVDTLSEKATEAEKEKHDLKSKLELLEKRVKILQEEKGILKSLEKCLKEKCCELQEEVSSLRSEHGDSNRKKSREEICRDESSPPEDEGISSSERSLSPEDMQREPRIYEVFNVQNETFDMLRNKNMHKKLEAKRNLSKLKAKKKKSDEEDETTIEEVIEELRNIVNDAESEQYVKEKTYDDKVSRCNQKSEINVSIKAYDSKKHRELEKEDSITSTRHSIHISDSTEYLNDKIENDSESEIVPSKIFPLPPRKSKSLVHLFVPPADDGVIYNRQDLLYEDACYSSDEGSDSLLSASRYHDQYQNGSAYDVHDFCGTANNRNLLNSIMDARDRTFNKRDTRRTRTRSGDEHLCRKASLRRSDSFQLSEKMHEYGNNQYGKCQLKDMFYPVIDTAQFKSINPVVMRSDSKLSRKDEADMNALIEAKKLTKSLDRIDEGLDSMVDIIMTSENRRMEWPTDWRPKQSNSRPNSDIGNHSSVTYTSKPNVKKSNNNYRNESRSSKSKSRDELLSVGKRNSDSQQRFLIPHPKLSSASNDNNSNSNSSCNNSSSFIIKRNSNNSFYSGQHFLRDAPASMTSLGLNGGNVHSEMKRALSPTDSKNNFQSNGVLLQKVTDMPSGLY